MVEQPYAFSPYAQHKVYFFTSQGTRTVEKAVQFTFMGGQSYNLGLADFHDGKMDFQIFTDNGDSWKVFLTVAAIVVRFTEVYPNAEVVIRGFGAKRLHLYHLILQQRRERIETIFEIFGYTDFEKRIAEPFQNEKKYEAFFVRRKKI